jgi:uncharacterized protein YggE
MKNEEKTCCGGGCGACGSEGCGSEGCGAGGPEGGACGDGGCGGCGGCGECGGGTASHWPHKALCGLLACLLLLTLSVWIGLKARNVAREHKFIGVPIERNVITMAGEGKVVGVPDVAIVDLGTTIERATVAEAQRENTRITNALHAKLDELGVAKEDVRTTAYNVWPAYDWIEGKQVLRGYTVSQNASVKMRDLDKVGDALGAAGELGVNQIGGMRFEIDDPEALRQEARIKAIENAKEKAEALAAVAGVTLRRVVSFEEAGGPVDGPIFYERAMGLGGDAAPPPTIEPGSSEIVITVHVTYEIE